MPNIVVLIEQVPDTWLERRLTDGKFVLDRESTDAVLDEINENAVEATLQLEGERGGNITVATISPDRATRALHEALSMGADDTVILLDDALEGSNAIQTAQALSNVIDTLEDVDLTITGNASTDGGTGSVPTILGVYHDLSVLTHLHSVAVDGDSITGEREVEDGIYQLKASLPAVVSVTEKANSPRSASLKSIIAAKKKPVTELTLDDVAVEAEQVGLEGTATGATDSTPRPAKTAGKRISDEGDGDVRLTEHLKAQRFI